MKKPLICTSTVSSNKRNINLSDTGLVNSYELWEM